MTRPWVPEAVESAIETFEASLGTDLDRVWADLESWHSEHVDYHDHLVVNLNPAANIPGPRVSRMLGSTLGGRPSLGYPGDKYETGLEGAEKIEMAASALLKRMTGARYVEYRVASGSMANLYAFMATAAPGDPVMSLAGSSGGHATHQQIGAAGLYGLDVHPIPYSPAAMTVDIQAFATEAKRLRPRLVVIGGSLVLTRFPVEEIVQITHSVGGRVLFDAAHLAGLIFGGAYPHPLDQGADLVTCSTYKSLGGPPGGLVLTNDPKLAERIDAIAYPGLTANFDMARTAALAAVAVDFLKHGERYAEAMAANAGALADALGEHGVSLAGPEAGPPTVTHHVAVDATAYGGGRVAALELEHALLLASEIALPDSISGLRLGTPEVTRWGMGTGEMRAVGELVARALRSDAPGTLAGEVRELRTRFQTLHFCET